MAPPLKIYSADAVTVNFAGISLEGGTGDDEFVTITKVEEAFTYKAGTDGSGTRSKNSNSLVRITVNLMQTSEKNALLSTIHLLDLKTEGGSGVAPFKVEDRNGTTSALAPESWIVKMPDWKAAREADVVQWIFEAHGCEYFVGGN
jgi:hypothetical protein